MKILITGGSRGIGEACVRAFCQRGDSVAFLYRSNHERAKALATETGAIAICADVSDATSATTATKEAIEKLGGIDLQLLGIGYDGHIGFNEPDTHFEKSTHKVVLDDSTIEANSRFFDSIDDVPKSALTMGVGSILKAKKIVIAINGAKKLNEKINLAYFGWLAFVAFLCRM